MNQHNFKSFQIRWNELDANRHVANSAYQELMNETRLLFLYENGFGQEFLHKHEIGPAILNENYTYLKEVLPSEKVFINLELLGYSENKRFMLWSHHLYNSKGDLCVYAKILITWFDLKTRKIIVLTDEFWELIHKMPKDKNFHLLTEEVLQKTKVQPHKIDISGL